VVEKNVVHFNARTRALFEEKVGKDETGIGHIVRNDASIDFPVVKDSLHSSVYNVECRSSDISFSVVREKEERRGASRKASQSLLVVRYARAY